VHRSESGHGQRLSGRVSLITCDAGRPRGRPALRRALAVLAIGVLTFVPDAAAHAPTTSIGRAVEAFRSVSVSYEPGAAVSDVEAGNFPHVLDSTTWVAFMPSSAAAELAGGPDAIAAEVARESGVQGTLVVLVGTRLGTWSNEIGGGRIAALADEARANSNGGSPAALVQSLVRSIQSEPSDRRPWAWITATIAVVGIGSLIGLRWLGLARARRQSSAP
jgi:hypothetical protein